jgi:hypothetical protein
VQDPAAKGFSYLLIAFGLLALRLASRKALFKARSSNMEDFAISLSVTYGAAVTLVTGAYSPVSRASISSSQVWFVQKLVGSRLIVYIGVVLYFVIKMIGGHFFFFPGYDYLRLTLESHAGYYVLMLFSLVTGRGRAPRREQ